MTPPDYEPENGRACTLRKHGGGREVQAILCERHRRDAWTPPNNWHVFTDPDAEPETCEACESGQTTAEFLQDAQ